MTVPDAETLERVVSWVVEIDPPRDLRFDREATDEQLEMPDVEIDDLLREALERGYVTGKRANYGEQQRWSGLRPTAAGLRYIKQWPPAGREHHEGPWMTGEWGTVARPILEGVRDDAYRHQMITGLHTASSGHERRVNDSAHDLIDSGYLSGTLQGHGTISEMRLTAAGRRALDPKPRDPVDEARLRLMTSQSDAVIHAVEVALGDRLRALAAAHIGAAAPRAHIALSQLNDALTARGGPGVYAKPWKKLIDAVLDVRNEYGHGRSDAMPGELASWVIDTVAILLTALPTADECAA